MRTQFSAEALDSIRCLCPSFLRTGRMKSTVPKELESWIRSVLSPRPKRDRGYEQQCVCKTAQDTQVLYFSHLDEDHFDPSPPDIKMCDWLALQKCGPGSLSFTRKTRFKRVRPATHSLRAACTMRVAECSADLPFSGSPIDL